MERMKKIFLSKEDFDKVLKQCLEKIDNDIKSHLGVLLTMYNKLQFEKWFQIELFKHLAEQLKEYDVEIHIEFELSQKTSKRGQTIDVVVVQDGKKFIGLELKIAPTNYDIIGFSKKTKRITDIIDDFINDLDKTTEFNHSYSLALIFPFPSDKNHRNYTDFNKQVERMYEKGKLTIWEGIKMENFIALYYLLSKVN
jgi:hypothetical protein